MKKMLCTLLVLVLALSMIPMTAAAAETGTVTVTVYYSDDYMDTYSFTVGDAPVTLTHGGYETIGNQIYEFQHYSNGWDAITIPAYDGTAQWHKLWGNIAEYYCVHTHNYRQQYNRTYHWMGCACGSYYDKEPHVDPAKDEDKICTCGYEFSDNCDLTTLWLKNMNLTKRFNKNTTEYTGEVYTYKEVSETTITATTFDALATVELPEDLSLKDGKNVFEITVTAEDKTTTKTYTVVAVKPVKVGGIVISSGSDAVSAEPKVTSSKKVATAKVPDLLLEEMAELAVKDTSAQIVLQPKFSKWGNNQIDVPLACSALKTIAADTKADVVIKTHFGNVTIPNGELALLAENAETLTVSIVKEESIKLYADGEEIKDIPNSIDRDLF